MTEVFPFEIIQARDRVLILFEKDYAVSHIWTDGRKLPGIGSTYMGQSIGKWDGNTLVVDTIGLKDITWIDRAGHPIVTHCTLWAHARVNRDRLQIDWTFDDPKRSQNPGQDGRFYRYTLIGPSRNLSPAKTVCCTGENR